MIKSICENPTANIMSNGECLNTFPLQMKEKNNDIHSQHFYSTLNWSYEPVQWEKKRRKEEGKKEMEGGREREGGRQAGRQADKHTN